MEWISHRGIRDMYAENTVESFKDAYDCGFRHFETDLRLTSDDKIVLFHDPIVSHEHRIEIQTSTYDQLKQCKLKGKTRIPLVEDLLTQFPDVCLIFDVKKQTDTRTIKALKELTQKMGLHNELAERVRFLTWSHAASRAVKDFFPNCKLLANQNQCIRAGLSCITGIKVLSYMLPLTSYAVTPSFLNINLFKKNTQDYYREHLRSTTIAYLPANELQVSEAFEAGFNEILTDYKVLSQYK